MLLVVLLFEFQQDVILRLDHDKMVCIPVICFFVSGIYAHKVNQTGCMIASCSCNIQPIVCVVTE